MSVRSSVFDQLYRFRLGKYSQYQADSFAIALKNGHKLLKQKQNAVKAEIKSESPTNSPVSTPNRSTKKRKRSSVLQKKDRLFFGTNVDFSEPMFKEQVAVSCKFPAFLFTIFRSFKNCLRFADWPTNPTFFLIWVTT